MKEAAQFYKMAADNGDHDLMNCYACMRLKGNGIPVDKDEAVVYFQKAIELDDHNAMTNYGMMLLTGDGIVPDKKEAARYFKIAADKGNQTAIINYAIILIQNFNFREGIRYLQMCPNWMNLIQFKISYFRLFITIILIYIFIHFI